MAEKGSCLDCDKLTFSSTLSVQIESEGICSVDGAWKFIEHPKCPLVKRLLDAVRR